MRIAVIDDEKYARIEMRHHINEWNPEAIVQEVSGGVEALELFEKERFDILFIDIHLGDVQGTTVASVAKRMMPEAKVIFATAFSEYAVKAFELQADDYLLKPIDPQRIRDILENCSQQKSESLPAESSRLAIRSGRHTRLIDIDEVTHIVTDGKGRGCYICLMKGDTLQDSSPLSDFEHRLREQGFYRIHKRSLVNLRQIQDIFPWKNNSFALRMRGSETILPIAREKHKELKRLLRIQ